MPAADSTALPWRAGQGTVSLAGILVIGVAYFVLAKLGLALASIHPSASPIWPATGFAVAVVLVWGFAALPGVFLGAFLANVTTAGSLLTSIAIAGGNTLEAFVAGWLVHRWSGGAATFDTPAGTAKFALVCFVPSTLLSASIGATTLALGGYAPWGSYLPIWFTWWLGDLAGALVVAPALVLWGTRRAAAREQWRESAAVCATAALVGVVAFSPLIELTGYRGALAFLAILPLMWAAIRLGQRDTATVALILSGFAVWGALADGGPFARSTVNESFLMLIAFMIGAAVPTLALSADVQVRKSAEIAMRQAVGTHRRAEQALRESESRLKRAQDVGGISNWEWSPLARTLWWSEGMYRLVGRDPGTFTPLEQDVLGVVHPSDRERLKAGFREVLSGARNRVDLEFRTVWPDGTVRWLLGRAEAEWDREGRAARVVGICLDVTERHGIEERLRERERRLAIIVNEVPAGIVQTDADGRYVLVNDWFCNFVGRAREDIIGRGYAELIHPDDVAMSERMRTHARETGEPYSVRRRYLRPNGTAAWAEVHLTLLGDSDQLTGVLAVVMDLNERMEAEERQKLLMNELNHRVKNTLASVQSLAVMSMRHSDSPQAFTAAFLSRMQALSLTHDLLTAERWRGASLSEVVQGELRPYASGDRARVEYAGPAVALTPQQVIHFGLLFHELATNAAKYGALSSPSGRLTVTWRVETVAGATHLKIAWSEQDGPPVVTPIKRGFGSRLIERTIREGLAGAIALHYPPDGFRCEVDVPI